MHINIQDKKDNIFLKRLEVSGTVTFEGATSSNAQLSEALAKEFKKDMALVVIKSIYTAFSHQEAKFSAVLYNTIEAKNTTEKMTKHMKKKAEEAKKAAAEKKESEQ